MTSLNQIKTKDRIIFLKKFTEELIGNIIKKRIISEKIEHERINQKIHSQMRKPEAREFEIYQPSRFSEIKPIKHEKIHKKTTIPKRQLDISELKRPIHYKRQINKIPIKNQIQPPTIQQAPPAQFQKSKEITETPIEIPERIKALKEITPTAQPRPEGFGLGKIDALLRNNAVQSIECPGPNKNILIKTNNKINITKLNLTQEEITDVLYSFANQAKIPVVGGILKAAVGSMVISAVISEFVGSRFIINKITPYSVIKK